jgi:DNA-binding phage protein
MSPTGIDQRGPDPAESLGSREKLLARLETAFGTGDAEALAPAFEEIARAKGLDQAAMTARSDFVLAISTLKAFGLRLPVKPA